jgi:hypothetical protein
MDQVVQLGRATNRMAAASATSASHSYPVNLLKVLGERLLALASKKILLPDCASVLAKTAVVFSCANTA